MVLIGTDFEVRVWETLLRIPMGRATTYSDIAGNIGKPKASRAVGAAVGKNPISFVVPCHRVHRQVRRTDRLSLGHHPQARHAGLGGRHGRRRIDAFTIEHGTRSFSLSHSQHGGDDVRTAILCMIVSLPFHSS